MPTSASPLKSTAPGYSEKVIARFWQTMSGIFFNKWTTQAGDSPSKVWINGLADLSADDIATGINACATRVDKWPPNLPEFRAMCKPAVAVIPASHRPYKPGNALPPPAKVTAPGDARAHLQAIRAQLKATPTPTAKPAPDDAEWLATRKRQDAAIVQLHGKQSRIDCSIYDCQYRAQALVLVKDAQP